jgi:hypothetical protein
MGRGRWPIRSLCEGKMKRSKQSKMYITIRAFDGDMIPIWDNFDYSDPNTNMIGHMLPGLEVKIIDKKFPGFLVQENNQHFWINEWNVKELKYDQV